MEHSFFSTSQGTILVGFVGYLLKTVESTRNGELLARTLDSSVNGFTRAENGRPSSQAVPVVCGTYERSPFAGEESTRSYFVFIFLHS